MDLSWLIWLFVLARFFVPLYQKQMLELRRNRAFHGFEQRRKTRLITMIHRQETMSFLGFPLARYIDIEIPSRSSGRSASPRGHADRLSHPHAGAASCWLRSRSRSP